MNKITLNCLPTKDTEITFVFSCFQYETTAEKFSLFKTEITMWVINWAGENLHKFGWIQSNSEKNKNKYTGYRSIKVIKFSTPPMREYNQRQSNMVHKTCAVFHYHVRKLSKKNWVLLSFFANLKIGV